MNSPSAFVRLFRLPSVLTVPGDALLGASCAGEGEAAASAAASALASSLLYLAGMALNDWADRARDARERPGRPIPAGDVAPAAALWSAVALTGSALAAARAFGGPRRLRGALPVAASVWAYDMCAKDTPAGPSAMALARALDVLSGAPRPARRAALPAAVAGAHAFLLTSVSAAEVSGASRALARRALFGVAAVTTAAAASIFAGARRRAAGHMPRSGSAPRPASGRLSAPPSALALGCLVLYGWTMAAAGLAAVRRPDPVHVQRFVGAGVFAGMLLQASLLAARGRSIPAAALVALWPAARSAGRRAAVT